MNKIHIIIKNVITVENGEICVIEEIMPKFGFYQGVSELGHCVCLCNSLNKKWGIDKEIDNDIAGVQHEEEFYQKFGCEPYEYVTLQQK